jgi:hypothetical protein
MHHPHQRDDVPLARPPVHDTVEGAGIAARIELLNVRRRAIAHHAQHTLDRLQDARHPPEGEGGRHESDHFTVVGPRVSPDDLDGIGRRIGIVEVGVKPVQDRPQFKSQVSSLRAQGESRNFTRVEL